MDMAKYMRERRAERRSWAKDQLGGKCRWCGSIKDLEFDHINPTDKVIEISNPRLLDGPLENLKSELDKCQLLCNPCHLIKNAMERSRGQVDHGGGVSGKKNCPCEPCRARKREYMASYKRKRR